MVRVEEIKMVKDKNVSCVSCVRQKRIDGSVWIYCKIYFLEMVTRKGFDETGELHGCSEHEKEEKP